MKATIKIATLFLFTSFLFACKKKTIEKVTDNTKRQEMDAFSTKKGSWWLYTAEDGSVFYRYATGETRDLKGLTMEYYYRIDTTSVMKEQIPEYYGKFDGRYLSMIDLDGSSTDYINFVYLKEGYHTGMTWYNEEKEKLQGWNVVLGIDSRVVSDNETIVVNGKVYGNVVHIFNNLKARLTVMPAMVDCGDLEVWYKKGI
ncbi:MAG: hypothetical protein IT256_00720 [Chitinophagaceae bacterium]|nr:hypothetical protein [Chitinophagaceae bacterium]